MTALTNTKWTLKARPEGIFRADMCSQIETETVDLSSIEENEVVIKSELLSVDAFLRTMLDAEAYHGSVDIGATLPALGIGTVMAAGSKTKLKVGSKVIGMLKAQTVAKLEVGEMGPMPLLRIPGVPESASLGLLGLTTGLTAWVGIFKVLARPRQGETVVVTAAAGAVGSIAAQLALTTGARVIGVCGGQAKCTFLKDTLKLTGAVDYKSSSATVEDQLKDLCPGGIDFMYDNVGGNQLDEVLKLVNPSGRIVICGAVSQYSGNLNKGKVQGPSEYLKLAEKGATMKGFNVMQYMSSLPLAIPSLLWHWNLGRIVIHEQIEVGIETFPAAMEKMFTGGHVGRLLVDLKEDKAPVGDN
mmetsp:Transcript_28609/g.57596  ORF Transcript_28609/g.57596 Transcript_28609/m.57596 type:complete len:358 (-) Transcript_28609:190-1263(-)